MGWWSGKRFSSWSLAPSQAETLKSHDRWGAVVKVGMAAVLRSRNGSLG